MEDNETFRVSNVVWDRVDGTIGWAVMAQFVVGPTSEPVCVDYRVRQVKRETVDPLDTFKDTIAAMSEEPLSGWPEGGTYSSKGIPAYVFREASQAKLIEEARQFIAQVPTDVSDTAKRALAAPERKPGRPPSRSLLEKLQVLAAVEKAFREGRTRSDVAKTFHMSDGAVRDLLSWARRDHQPQLFTGTTQGRRGGAMTPEGRELLQQLENGVS